MTTAWLLEAEKIKVRYGRMEALHSVSIKVGAGQIVTVIGPNGAGKSTLLSALMGLQPVVGGSIKFDGAEVGRTDVEDRVVRGITLVPESRALFSQMTVEDNLLMGAFCRHRMGHRDHVQSMEMIFETFPRLKERRKQEAGTLSGGERQMVAIGRALMAKPRLLMLDEPSLGLAPLIVREIFDIIAGLRKLGVSILLVEQNARAALNISDYGYVLELGAVSLEDDSASLASNTRVDESYLGGKSASGVSAAVLAH